VDDVIATPVPEQMPQDAKAKDERRSNTPTTSHVQRHPRSYGDDPDPADARVPSSLPLAKRQVRHLVALVGEPLREIPVPTLGAAHSVRIEAVVDDANTHRYEGIGDPVPTRKDEEEPETWPNAQ